ncbi:MAG: glycosyltransferase family 39 protein [Elusimicrobia bacterium]|nr:glycosyltransferase family 39 protein [Elusimicrobiota bacterium]
MPSVFTRARTWAIVGAVAFALRFFFVLYHPPLPLQGDALGYNEYAVHLMETGRYADDSGDRGSRMPGYPIFLAAVYSLAGRTLRAVQIAQCVAGALTCVFIALIADSFLPAPWPLIAGLTAACYFDLIAPSRYILSENLYQLFIAGAFAGLYRLSWKPLRRSAAFGAGIAAAYFMRPEALVPGMAALALAPLIKELKFGWSKSLAAAAITALLIAPWIARNRIIFQRWIPSSTAGGVNLYSGLALPLLSRGLISEPFYAPPPKTGELAAGAAYTAQFKILWRRVGAGRRIKAYAFNFLALFYPFLPGYDATFMLLLPFWLAAILISFKRPPLIPLSCAVISSIAVYTVFGGPVSRYRQEYAPIAVCLAVLGIYELWRRKPELLKRAGPVWAAINAAIWILPASAHRLMILLRNAAFR